MKNKNTLFQTLCIIGLGFSAYLGYYGFNLIEPELHKQYSINTPKIITGSILLLVSIFGSFYSIHKIKTFEIASNHKERSSTSVIVYQIGAFLILLSILVFIGTLLLIIYLIVTNTSGVPAGIGFGFALILFTAGVILKVPNQPQSNEKINVTAAWADDWAKKQANDHENT